MRVQFQPHFDDSAYRKAKERDDHAKHNKAKHGKTESGTKPSHSTLPPAILTVKPKTPPSGNVGMDTDDGYPSVETLLNSPAEVSDLTGGQESSPGQSESIRQQPTPETDGNNQGKEAIVQGVNTGRGEEPAQQRCSPKLGGWSASGAGMSEHTGRESEPSKAPRPCGQAASGHELITAGCNHPKSPVDQGDALSDEDDEVGWEAVDIIGEEVIDEVQYYMIVWKPTLEPKCNVKNAGELIKKWETKKARIRAREGGSRSGSGIKKQGATGKSRVEMDKLGSAGTKRGRGRPRKG